MSQHDGPGIYRDDSVVRPAPRETVTRDFDEVHEAACIPCRDQGHEGRVGRPAR
jgi:hypothetical protein